MKDRKNASGRRMGAWVGHVSDSLILFGLVALLIWPLFTITYLDNWASIESTFIADARFLIEHWPHPRWQPLWYGGTRFDYIYPPALRYGTAGLAMELAVPTARAYHLYVAFFYCLGIVGVYLLARTLSGSRGTGWAAALATAVVSPSYVFYESAWADAVAHHLPPYRLHALVHWGEGPHVTALALVGPALAASCWAIKSRSLVGLAVASLLCALVVSHNFYGGVALAILYFILVWGLWVTHQDRRIWTRSAAIGVLAYGLTAFWLVPSYLQITSANLMIVGAGGEPPHIAIAICIGAVFLAATYRLSGGRVKHCYSIFLAGGFVSFVTIVLGHHLFNLRVVGTPWRFVPELDLVLILFFLEAPRRLWSWRPARHPEATTALKAAIIFLAGVTCVLASPYLRNPWRIYQEDTNYRQRIEYRLSEWMAKNRPDSRSLVGGSVRFWYNTWHDLAQLGGGSDQGLINQLVPVAIYQIRVGESGEIAVKWLRSFGVDLVAVHDAGSQEIYHDMAYPKKFEGLLPVLYDEGEGDVIYKVRRRYSGLARVVESSAVERLRPIQGPLDREGLDAYLQVIEHGPEPRATLTWEGTDAMRVSAVVEPGQMILLQVTYDPAWRAYSETDCQLLVIRKDILGQMLVESPPGKQNIRVVFELPFEYTIGRLISLAAALIVVSLVVVGTLRGRNS